MPEVLESCRIGSEADCGLDILARRMSDEVSQAQAAENAQSHARGMAVAAPGPHGRRPTSDNRNQNRTEPVAF